MFNLQNFAHQELPNVCGGFVQVRHRRRRDDLRVDRLPQEQMD